MPRRINPHLDRRQLGEIDLGRDELRLLTRMRPGQKQAERMNDGAPAAAALDQGLRTEVVLHPLQTRVVDVIAGAHDEDLARQRVRLHQGLDLAVRAGLEARDGREGRPCAGVDVLCVLDEGLARPVHRVFPAAQAAEIVARLGAPCAQRVAAALGPDGALDVRGLQLAVHAEEGAGAVDVQLRVEEGGAVGDALGDAEGNGDGRGAAGGDEGGEFGGGGLDDEGLFDVLGQCGDLVEGWVAFDEVLWVVARQ